MTSVTARPARTLGLAGTRQLLWLAWRRSRVMILTSVVAIVAMIGSSAAASVALFSSPAELAAVVNLAGKMPAYIAMYGHIREATIGAASAGKLLVIAAVALAVLCIVIVRRHTRAEEESGRFELIGWTAVGRRAPLAAGVILASATALVTGLLIAVSCAAAGLPGMGSVVFGLVTTGVGLTFTAVTAIAAQLSSTGRTCGALAFGALGISYVLRMIGDLQEGHPLGVLAWLSPMGWALNSAPWAGDRLWVFGLFVLLYAGCLGVAGRLLAGRDLGSGLLPERPGPARGEIATAAGLAWRLQHLAAIGWFVVFVALGVLLGFLLENVGDFLQSPQTADMLRLMGGTGMVKDLYISVEAGFMAVFASCFAVASVLRMRGEETELHLEPVLATATTRRRFLASHGVIALVGSAALCLGTAIGLAATHAVAVGSLSSWWRDFTPMLVQIPAVWVVGALTMALFGWLQRWSILGWALVIAFMAIGQLGELLKIPTWLQQASPFAHTPKLPAGEFSATPVLILVAITAVTVVLAEAGFRRRDIG